MGETEGGSRGGEVGGSGGRVDLRLHCANATSLEFQFYKEHRKINKVSQKGDLLWTDELIFGAPFQLRNEMSRSFAFSYSSVWDIISLY